MRWSSLRHVWLSSLLGGFMGTSIRGVIAVVGEWAGLRANVRVHRHIGRRKVLTKVTACGNTTHLDTIYNAHSNPYDLISKVSHLLVPSP